MSYTANIKNVNLTFFLTVVLLSIVLNVFHDGLSEFFRYERTAIFQGEYWRLFSAHLVHLNTAHMLMNLAALVILWVLFMQHQPTTHWWFYAIASSLAVSLGLLWLNPHLSWYVGLSGGLHGLIAVIALNERRTAPTLGNILILALFFKLAWEQFAGPLPGSSEWIEAPVVVDAHLYGAISACVLWLISRIIPSEYFHH